MSWEKWEKEKTTARIMAWMGGHPGYIFYHDKYVPAM